MIEPEREELLSAYLDGEVSSEERALVDGWLAESAELRQLRDEFVAMRSDLQALPRREVGHDLAATVIRRSISVADADSSTRAAPAVELRTPDEPGLGNVVAEWWQRGSQGRRFLWPVLAVAAALAILVFDARQRPEEFEVAKAPDVAPAPAESQEQAPFGASAPADEAWAPPTAKMSAPESALQGADSALPAPEPANAAPAAAAPPAAEMRAPMSEPRQGRLPKSLRKAEFESGVTPRYGTGSEQAGGQASGSRSTGSAADLGTGRRMKTLSPAADSETIVVPVTAQYLEARTFEKLLDERKIPWRKQPVSLNLYAQTGPPTQRTAPLRSLGRSPLQTLYVLDADSVRVNEVLALVPQADHLMEGNRAQTLKVQQPAGAGTTRGVQVLLVAPAEPSPGSASPASGSPTDATSPATRSAR